MIFAAQPAAVRSEIEPQGDLPRSIASLTLGQRGLQYPEITWVADVQCRWSEIGVIQDVGERGLETNTHPLANIEALC